MGGGGGIYLSSNENIRELATALYKTWTGPWTGAKIGPKIGLKIGPKIGLKIGAKIGLKKYIFFLIKTATRILISAFP